jgi:PAS domain S-box-containing protein
MHIGKKTQYKAVLSLMVVILFSAVLLNFIFLQTTQTSNRLMFMSLVFFSIIIAFLISILFYRIYTRPIIRFWLKADRQAKINSRKQFADFMDDLPLGVFIKNDQSRPVYLNKYMDKVFGKSNCIDKTPYNIYDRSTADRVVGEDRRVLAGENVMVEEVLTDKNGKERVYMTHKFLMQEELAEPMIGGISIEITRRREAEYKLRILSRAIRNSPVCVIITDPEGFIEYVNPAFVNSTGYSFAEVMGENMRIINSGKHEKAFFKEMWSTINMGRDWQGEILNRKKDNTLFWELVNISAVKNRDGEITHFVAIKDNISKRKQMEQDLLRAKEKAEESDRLKSAFLANMSHEIRTPMNAIVGLSSLLSDPELLHSERQSFSSIIQENSQVLLQLIDDIIDISKIEAGQIKIRPVICRIHPLLADIYESFSVANGYGEKAKLVLTKKKQAEELITFTDHHRLRQIIVNLISNALKFTEAGIVEFGCRLRGDKDILFFVKDTGIGIPPDKQHLIFDRFRQVDDTETRNHQGAGLGLSISKSLVELLGGSIWFESEKDRGSIFYFTIPYIRPSEDEQIKEAETFPDQLPEFSDKTILVIEDIEINFKIIEALLRKTGVTLLWARSGKQALEFCRLNNSISLILLDLNMPDVHGLDLLTEIKKFREELPVIIQTAYAMNGERELSQKAGCDGFITKPIQQDQLISLIQDCLCKV